MVYKYLKKVPVIYRKTFFKKLVFCWHLEGHPASGSTPKCHGSGNIDEDHNASAVKTIAVAIFTAVNSKEAT
jgi:hypothetical protein